MDFFQRPLGFKYWGRAPIIIESVELGGNAMVAHAGGRLRGIAAEGPGHRADATSLNHGRLVWGFP